MSKKVDLFIVGFMKSGTTALAQFLSEHPDVCMSVPKEPGYFATDKMAESDSFHNKPKYFKTRTPEQYDELFAHSKNEKVYAEASTAYIYSPGAAANIKNYNPSAKIVIMIREPVAFLHSLHEQYLNETVENEVDFAKALELENDRKSSKNVPPRVRVPSYLYYSERIKYATQIERYYKQFPKEQIMIVYNDEFMADNSGVFQMVCDFIGIDSAFKPDFTTVHGSKAPRSKLVNKLLHVPAFKNILYKLLGGHLYTKIHKRVNKVLLSRGQRSQIPTDVYESLRQKSAPEVKKLSELLDRDLMKQWDYK